MSTVRRITRNTVMLNAARIISTLGKFFLFIWVAREMGDGVLGQFTFAIIFTSFFGIIISLGMDDYLVREVARDSKVSRMYLANITTIRLLLALIVFTALVVTINIMGYPEEMRLAVYLFGGYTVFTAFSFLFRANFRAFERMEWDALLEVIEAVFTTGFGFLVVFLGYGLVPLCLVFFIGSVLNVIVSLIISARSFVLPRLAFDWPFWKTTILKAAPFSMFGLFILYPRIDTILLSSMKGDEVVGGYNAAYQIVMAFSPIVMNFMIALVPLISRYFLHAKSMLNYTYEKSFKYLVMIGFPVSVGGMVLAHRIIPFLYGPGFDDSVLALQILVWNCLLLAMSRPMFYILGAINRQGTCAILTMSALILSIGLNFIAVPIWSYIGSGVITIVVGVLVTAGAWIATARYGFRLPVMRLLWSPLAASLAMGGVVYAMDTMLDVGLLLVILAGFFAYIVFLFLFGGISPDDRNLMKQAIKLAHTKGPKQPVEAEPSGIRSQAGPSRRPAAER